MIFIKSCLRLLIKICSTLSQFKLSLRWEHDRLLETNELTDKRTNRQTNKREWLVVVLPAAEDLQGEVLFTDLQTYDNITLCKLYSFFDSDYEQVDKGCVYHTIVATRILTYCSNSMIHNDNLYRPVYYQSIKESHLYNTFRTLLIFSMICRTGHNEFFF